MKKQTLDLDFSTAVQYHYGEFPPNGLDYIQLVGPLTHASAALARYDQMLRSMHNSEILLAPLRSKEAVISSRMEGTVTTLDEVLKFEADQENGGSQTSPFTRTETMEVAFYQIAMRQAQEAMRNGAPLSPWLIRSAHKTLLRFGRGATKKPGEYKSEQNYLADRGKRRVLFIPASAEHLQQGMDILFSYINESEDVPLLKASISHVEFEALHPFYDGNGRIGRMLITLLLWEKGVISQPHFYVSEHLEGVREDYIEKMRNVSRNSAWTEWCVFFLDALTEQAYKNIEKAEEIGNLYEAMKVVFRDALSSPYAMTALDFMFSNPVFRNNRFTNKSGIPRPTAARFARILSEQGLLSTIEPAAGRRPAMYAFEPLLKIVRES